MNIMHRELTLGLPARSHTARRAQKARKFRCAYSNRLTFQSRDDPNVRATTNKLAFLKVIK